MAATFLTVVRTRMGHLFCGNLFATISQWLSEMRVAGASLRGRTDGYSGCDGRLRQQLRRSCRFRASCGECDMQHAFRGRGWRATFVLCLVGSLVTPVAAHATASVATMPPGPFDIAPSINTSTVPTAAAVTINTVAMATSTPAPLGAMSTEATSTLVAASPNADLGSRDSSTAQYTQSDANHVTLRLYNAPVGYPDQGQWRLRDPRLSVAVGQGPVAPSHVPFSLQIAQNDGSFQVATLTTPDGTTLGLSLPTMGRRAPTPVRGRVGEDGVTYPSPTSANDVTLKPTLSGIDLGLIIHNPSDAATMAVPLILDPRTHLVSQANGAVLVVRPITDGAANGSPLVLMDAPEYVVGSAVALDSAPLAQTDSGPVTTTVQTDQGQPRLSIHLDPAWLHAAGRQFPVYLTVPILTAFSAMESGTFGTTNSCAPTTPMVSADAVVGTHGPCAYQGYLDFDINALRPGTQITAASLRLYTPDRSGPTAVQVYRNVGAANTLAVPSWAPPNWQTAPVSSGPGIVESAGGTQWHSWDVTSIVQDWIQDRSTKQGFTLRGDGAPIVFATAGGSGVTDPAVVPYLDITYAPTMAPLFSDPGVTTIYGVSGAFTADSYGCPTPGAVLSCDGAINVSTVAHNLGGAYIRFGASLPCQGPPNDTTWWDGTGANKDNKGSLHDILNSAINDGVIPIVNFLPNGCSTVLSSAQWQQAMQNFVSYLRGTVHYPQSRMIYFEIGNEENMFHKSYGDYPTIFAGAASGLESSLDTSPQYVNYRILTGGMITPSATSSCQDSTVWRDPSYPANIQMASAAITAAKNNGVQQSHLAVAVHPYHYQNSQSNSADWQNFYHNAGTGPTDPCSDLWSMIGTWEGLGLPVIFTEDNWADQPKDNAPADQQRNTVAKGSYLVDLFTWLHRHQLDVSSSGVRVLIFRGADTPLPPDMGIYSPNGSTNDHMVTISSTLCLNGNVAGTHSIASNFVQLLHSGCNETVEPAATNTPTPTKATSTPTATATNTPTNTPTPTLVPVKRTVGYVYPGDNSQHVFSISADGHIHEYYGTSSWQDNDLSNLTGAPAAAVGSGLAATVYSYDQSQHVDYITPDGHVHELAWQPNGQWRESDLSSITGASPATPGTSLATYVYPPDASSASMRHVDYISTDGHIHDLLCPSDNNWQNQDLSSMTGAPTASVGSGLDGYAFAYDNSQHVNYTTSDGHIHEIFWNGLWHTSDLSSQVGTSPAMRGSTLAAYAYPNTTASNAMMHVQFISQDGHVHELLWTTDAVWHDNDLSTITGAPTAASGAALDAYVLDYNNTQHVNYTTSDGHIHELFTNGVWHHMDLTSIAGGTGAAVGSGLDGYSYPDDTSSDAEMHVNFIGSDGHVHELLWTANGVWHNDDLTTMASPPRLASLSTRLSGYTVVYDNSQREDYVSSDGHIHELRWRNGWWQDTDLSGLLNAPPDMIGSGLASYARPNDATSNAMMHVFYISTDGHIHELLWSTNGGWLNNDLSSVTGAPAAASGSGLTAYLFAHDNSQHIDYTSTDGHIHEIFDNGMWHNMDLSAMAGAAPALLDGTIAGYAFPNDTSSNAMMHVDYISLDGHIHELQWTSDAVWHNNDLSTITDAPAASLSSGLDSYTFAWDNSQHVNYMTPDGHIHELYANGSWHSSDLRVRQRINVPILRRIRT